MLGEPPASDWPTRPVPALELPATSVETIPQIEHTLAPKGCDRLSRAAGREIPVPLRA